MRIFTQIFERMSKKDIVNWSGLSEHLTGEPTNIRRNKIPRHAKEAVKELLDYIEYWKTKHNLKCNQPK